MPVERMIQQDLAAVVEAGSLETCVHLVHDGTGRLVGLGAHAPVANDELETAERISCLAVVHDRRRQGIGTQIKIDVMIESAPRGVRTILSEVHRRNVAMKGLNAKLSAVTEPLPDDGDYLRTVVLFLMRSDIDDTGEVVR